MVDEIWDRQYQSGRHQLHSGVDLLLAKLGRSIATTFRALTEIQFAAPWKAQSKDVGCA